MNLPTIIEAAIDTFAAGERIDMTALAKRLRIGRATLYRCVGDRNQLLRDMLWELNQRLYASVLATAPARGPERLKHIVCDMIDKIVDNQAFERFLQHEGLGGLELVTSNEGLRGRIMERTIRLIEHETQAGNYTPPASPATLADAAVALSEYFLYAQFVVKGFQPKADQAKMALMLLFREDAKHEA